MNIAKNDGYPAGDQKKEKINNMATTLEIVRGISQAAANAYDGSHIDRYNADGEARTVGLKREEGNPITDPRVMDGFKVKFSGSRLCILYQSDIKLKDSHDSKFEQEIEGMIEKIKSFLQKEYKNVTGDSLKLSKIKGEEGEMKSMVQTTSRVRAWVQASKWFEIGGIGDAENIKQPSEDRLRDTYKKFLSLGKKSPKAKNVTRKEA